MKDLDFGTSIVKDGNGRPESDHLFHVPTLRKYPSLKIAYKTTSVKYSNRAVIFRKLTGNTL